MGANLDPMSTPPLASVANATSTADHAALVSAANQQFIDQTTLAIANAQQQGFFVVFMTTFENCDVVQLASYFQGLGYTVIFPDYAPINGAQPAQLFGPDYVAYWQHQLLYFNGRKHHNPTRMGFSWTLPSA